MFIQNSFFNSTLVQNNINIHSISLYQNGHTEIPIMGEMSRM